MSSLLMAYTYFSPQDAAQLLHVFCPSATSHPPLVRDEQYVQLLRFFEEETKSFQRSLLQTEVPVQSADILRLVVLLVQNQMKKKEEICKLAEQLQCWNGRPAELAAGIDLCARLWCTTSIRPDAGPGLCLRDGDGISWHPAESLGDCLRHHIKWHRATQEVSGQQMPSDLTIARLSSVCGLRIAWTSNLADHLLLDRNNRTIHVYEHKVCLISHMDDLRLRSENIDTFRRRILPDSLFPPGLIEDTLDTLNLLFPFADPSTGSLLDREGRCFHRLGLGGRQVDARLDTYPYWGHRLEDLMRFYLSPPHGWTQVFTDRRDRVSWATFWMAVLILALTILSMVFGMISTSYTVKQYNLALAQACASDSACQSLAHYCRCR